LLQRRREGVRLTDAGTVLLEQSRTVLSMVDQGVRRTLDRCPLTATAALVWSGDLPRELQQVLFDTADSIAA